MIIHKTHLNNKLQQGLTLVELLAVMTIIATLVAVGAVVYTNIMKNTRDQSRMKDLGSMKQALELYRNVNHSYPGTSEFAAQMVPVYLPNIPADPSPSTNRVYKYFSLPSGCTTYDRNCTTFYLCALKEGDQSYPTTVAGCQTQNCLSAGTTQCNIELGP
ncbi:type II secretion system GspH family protein [Patescibacteria group bacterium]|nr:type II secretion system GspH family protein [Patescibacteria group bacterium]MCL5409936.1 type II secretion system GspH family protein [Patescibacteria group bacterium]